MLGLKWRWAAGFVALVAAAGAHARAAEMGAAARYVSADVVAVGAVDLTKVDFPAILAEAERWGLGPQQHAAALEKAEAVQASFAELVKLGAKQAVALLRMSDLGSGGPSWVIEVDGDPQRVVEWLRPRLADARTKRLGGDFSKTLPQQLEVVDNRILGAPTLEQLAKLKASAAGEPSAETQATLNVLAAADAGFVALGDADSRRVLREMFPTLPAPFSEINGQLLADGVKWAGFLVKLPPDSTLSFTVEAAEPTAAATLEQATTKGLELLKGLCMVEMVSGPPDHKARAAALLPLVPLLKPTVEGARLSLTLGDDQAEVDAARTMLAPAVDSAREAANRTKRMNNFKNIALAMFNYEAQHKSFPAAATYDRTGKPLLSWRVQLLPYLDRPDRPELQKLYDEFRHDEPWDSEHNRKLVERMPEIYADPDSAVQRAIGAGHTTTVVPSGAGTVFDRREGTKLSEISDGTAMTILTVEAIPTRAVIWTKPEDWEVDFADPLAAVKRSNELPRRGNFVVGMCDGSVRTFRSDVDPKDFASQLTRAADDAVTP